MTAGRWRVGLAATLALAGFGLLFAEPTLLGAAVVPLSYICYGLVSGVSTPQLRATRTFDPEKPGPGERVTVRLRVENVGDRVVPDLRIVDGVRDLAVVEGAPQVATALAPGETATLSYDLVTRRGEHEFEDPLARVRSLSASESVVESLDVEAGETLTCRTPAQSRLADTVTSRMGELSSGGYGEGTEFHATREYRRGDPMRRIDWRHVAKTGEFVTVEYRDQQTTQTAVVVDVRGPGRVRPVPRHPSGAVLSVEAADRLLDTLDRRNVLAGLGVVGVDADGPLATAGSVAWADNTTRRVEPSVLLADVRAAVETGSAPGESDAGPAGGQPVGTVEADAAAGTRQGEPARPDGGPAGPDRSQAGESTEADSSTAESVEQLLAQLPAKSQVVVCTPALDDWAVEFGRVATGRGHDLIVVSPDITATGAVGSRCAGIRRRLRLQALAELGEVVDWAPGRRVAVGPGEVG
jgi:hypothetical protein